MREDPRPPRRCRRESDASWNPTVGGVLGGVFLAVLAQGLRGMLLSGRLSPGIFSGGPFHGALVLNRGLAFSLFPGILPGTLWAGGGLLLLGCLAVWWGHRLSPGAWALCWGGALSNAFERWTEGQVLDYLGIGVPWSGVPLFLNLADCFLIAGVGWSLIDMYRWEPLEPELKP